MRVKEILPGVRITSDRCLILDDGPTVVLGDLHLGYERALEMEGMYVPRTNTESIRDSLNKILCRYEPQRVVLLGDVKHDFKRSGFEEKREVKKIVSSSAKRPRRWSSRGTTTTTSRTSWATWGSWPSTT